MSEHPEQAIRAEAIELLLREKDLVSEAQIDAIIQQYNSRTGPLNGALLVAKAWCDAEFKAALLEDGTRAMASFEFTGGEVQKLVVKENSENVHNLVVCTLCSCYPWAVLGLPPRWYKDPAYRSRVVKEPRKVLGEFGVRLPDATLVNVWDSSAEIRYMVLPQRPSDSDGLSEDELAALVTRDSMIGVELLDS